jgi:aquaporin NIP
MTTKHQPAQYLAEFIGTFFLIFFGCGSMILAEVMPSYNGSLVPIVWGGAVSIMIYAVGHISGAHFNPAVTISFWATKRFPGKRVGGYLISQLLGATLASISHLIISGTDHNFGATVVSIPLAAGFLTEVIVSFALMFVILSVATDSRAVGELAGIAIGTTVALSAFVSGPLTNASMNPARSLAPAFLTGDYSQIWLFILAPVIGAVLGAKTYEWIRCHESSSDDQHGCC